MQIKNRKRAVLISAFVGVAVLLAVLYIFIGPYVFYIKPVESVFNVRVEDCQKLTLCSGDTGRTVEITDMDEMEKIVDLLSTARLRKSVLQDYGKGWRSSWSFYDDEGTYMGTIQFTNYEPGLVSFIDQNYRDVYYFMKADDLEKNMDALMEQYGLTQPLE